MGNPAFYYYPDPTGSLEIIDLGEPLSDLQAIPVRERSDALSLGGTVSCHHYTGSETVRIVLERFTSTTLERQLANLSAHLERGGVVGFSRDVAKTWCTFTKGLPVRGATSIQVGANVLKGWSSGGTITAGDEIVIETALPELNRERTTVSAYSAPRITTAGLKYTATMSPVSVRWRDCWPVLYLPERLMGQEWLTSFHRLTYTLDLTLQTLPGALSAMSTDNDGLLRGSSVAGAGTGFSLDDLVAGSKATVSTGLPGYAFTTSFTPPTQVKR